MKIRTFTTASTTLLGAALIGYGQTQNDQRPDNSPGAPATQQTSGAAGASQTPGVEGGRSQSTTDTPGAARSGDIQRPGQTGTNPGTTAGRGQNETRTTGPADTTAGARGQTSTTPTDPTRRQADHDKQMNWDDAEKSDVQLSELPDRARNTLNSVSAGAKIDDKVTRLSKDDQHVFEAKLNRQGEEDLHIFVKEDGTVLKTMQKAEFSSAPENIRSAVQREMGGSSAEPKEFYRIISNGETSYAVKADKEGETKMIHVDSTGKLIKDMDKKMDRPDPSALAPQSDGLQDTKAAGTPGENREREDRPATRTTDND